MNSTEIENYRKVENYVQQILPDILKMISNDVASKRINDDLKKYIQNTCLYLNGEPELPVKLYGVQRLLEDIDLTIFKELGLMLNSLRTLISLLRNIKQELNDLLNKRKFLEDHQNMLSNYLFRNKIC